MLILSVPRAHAIPAFARKYGLRCSACHVAWPVLNDFGWRFKDNGYQLMNDRDAPIWQHPSYWPVTFRTTPNWHLKKPTGLRWMPGVVSTTDRWVSRSTVSIYRDWIFIRQDVEFRRWEICEGERLATCCPIPVVCENAVDHRMDGF